MTATLSPPLDEIRSRRDAARSEVERHKRSMRDFLAAAETRGTEGRVLQSDQREFDRMQRELDRLEDEARAFGDRYEELLELERRMSDQNAARRSMFAGDDSSSRGVGGAVVVNEGDVYRPNATVRDPSFFRDLALVRQGNIEAAERLSRQSQISRAADLVSNVAGQGAEFSPPLWLVSEFIALARPGRVTADLSVRDVLPSGTSSLNLPKIASGTAVAIQQTQGTTVTDVAATTTSVSTGIVTLAGKQVTSNQMLFQSPVDFGRIILSDLAADYAKQLDSQVILGTGANGQLRGLKQIATSVAFTTTQPALTSVTSANSFYNVVLKASAAVNTTRYAPADSIVMTPQRWAWALSQLDTTTRPIIAAGGQSFNSVAVSEEIRAEGSVGQLAGLDVYIDPQVPTTVSTNQDVCFVVRSSDLYLWESNLMLETFTAPYADSNSTLFRAVGYSGYIPDRYTASVQMITGTGMVTTAYL